MLNAAVEKVSQDIFKEGDELKAAENRKVADVKVRLVLEEVLGETAIWLAVNKSLIRKVTRLVVKTSNCSQMSGSLRKSFLVSEVS